jgi:hypothetical protein
MTVREPDGTTVRFCVSVSGDGTRLIWPTYSIVNRQLVDTLVITTVP